MTYLSIAPGGPARGVHHRRPVADRPARRRHLRRDVPAARSQRNRALLRALPRRRRPGPRHPPPARRRGRPAAVRRPAHRAPVPPARHVARRQRRLRAAPPRPRAAVRLAGVPARRRGRPVRFGAQPDLRDAPRVVVRRRRGDALVGAPAAARRGRGGGLLHGRARLPVDVGGLRRACAAIAPPPSCSPSTRGRACTTPTGCARNEVPVAATIYVNDLYVERDFAEETAADHPRPAAVDHRRVRAQRPARRRRARPRPADRPGARPGLTPLHRAGSCRTGNRAVG